MNKRYCAFCRSARKVNLRKHLSWISVLGMLGLAGILGALIWGGVDPRSVPIFAALLVLGEMITLFRYRLGIVCPKCGFDPLLYRKNPRLASERVRSFFERRSGEADFVLTGGALREVQRRLTEADRLQKRRRTGLERRVMERQSSPEP